MVPSSEHRPALGWRNAEGSGVHEEELCLLRERQDAAHEEEGRVRGDRRRERRREARVAGGGFRAADGASDLRGRTIARRFLGTFLARPAGEARPHPARRGVAGPRRLSRSGTVSTVRPSAAEGRGEELMEPKNEPLEPTIKNEPERRGAAEPDEETRREDEGYDQPRSSAQKTPPPGPQP